MRGPDLLLPYFQKAKEANVRFVMVPEAIEEYFPNPMNSRKTSPNLRLPTLSIRIVVLTKELNEIGDGSFPCVVCPRFCLLFFELFLFLSFLVIVPAPPFVFRRRVPRVFLRVSSYRFASFGGAAETIPY